MRTMQWVGALWIAGTLGSGEVVAEDSIVRVATRVDELVEAKWKEARVEPAGLADDAEFLRRLYLDVAGRVPTSEEARTFLLSKEADKRVDLVEALLAGPDFADAWARRLSLLLLGRGRAPRQVDRAGFEAYLRRSLAEGKPYDRLVRELLTGSGSPVTAPEVNFLLRFERKPEDTAESVSASFLGVSIGCARCRVIGATDENGEEIRERPMQVPDFFASLCHALGMAPDGVNYTPLGRPIPFTDHGVVASELFA